jgi:hypothetical protein
MTSEPTNGNDTPEPTPVARAANDKSILAGLKQSGIPEFVYTTTLVKEGKADIREVIASKGYQHNGQLYGFYVFTQRNSSVTKARRVFYLIAKEMFLSGVTVYCVSMPNLVAALNANDYSVAANAIDNVQMVFVTDFFEDDAICPLSPGDAGRVRSWVRDKFEVGGAVSFLSDASLERCGAWWSNAFLRFLSEHTISNQL